MNASVLKVKLATAIIGISSIHLLKTFINAGALRPTQMLMWQTVIHVAFLLSALAIACTDRHAGRAGRRALTRTDAIRTEKASDHDHQIRHADLVESVAAALQYISYYHPADYIAHLARAYEREQSPAAKDAIAQILTNSKMCAEGRRPICQDTGIVNVFLKIGMDVRFEGFPGSVEDAVNEGVRRATSTPTTSCARRSSPTRTSSARTRRTTRRPWCT